VTARKTAKNWMPDAYEQVTGEEIQPGESRMRDERIWFDSHADDMISTSAIASSTDPGMVVVQARIGGRGPHGRGPTETFLVPKDKYHRLRNYGYVIGGGDQRLVPDEKSADVDSLA